MSSHGTTDHSARAADALVGAGFERTYNEGWHAYVHPAGDAALINPETHEAHYLSGYDAPDTRKDLSAIIRILEKTRSHTVFNARTSTLFAGGGAVAAFALTQDPYVTVLGGALGALLCEASEMVRAHRARTGLEAYTQRLVSGHEAWERILT